MVWIAISLAISLTLSFLLPFPLSLVAIIGVFIAMSYYIRRRQMRSMGMTSSNNTGGGGFGSLFGGSGGGGGINYVCIACGQRFKGGSCPRCGSKMKKAEFWLLLLDKVNFNIRFHWAFFLLLVDFEHLAISYFSNILYSDTRIYPSLHNLYKHWKSCLVFPCHTYCNTFAPTVIDISVMYIILEDLTQEPSV